MESWWKHTKYVLVDTYQITRLLLRPQWDSASNTWQKIGDVVDAVGQGRKQLYQGKEYDYVFDVDIQDGVPPLKLPYNVTGMHLCKLSSTEPNLNSTRKPIFQRTALPRSQRTSPNLPRRSCAVHRAEYSGSEHWDGRLRVCGPVYRWVLRRTLVGMGKLSFVF